MTMSVFMNTLQIKNYKAVIVKLALYRWYNRIILGCGKVFHINSSKCCLDYEIKVIFLIWLNAHFYISGDRCLTKLQIEINLDILNTL